jgi:flavin-dependent dehydrogenase
MNLPSRSFDVIIAGAGPAGSSAAIHLATNGLSVLLADQKKFPRPKLCGEFISPECWEHFERLGVNEKMVVSQGTPLRKTVFYARDGRSVAVPSEWFGAAGSALGLSRSEMDHNLLNRAKECGVTVLEEAQAYGLVMNDGVVKGVTLRTPRGQENYLAPITIDATGRARALARKLDPDDQKHHLRKKPLVAFKAHQVNAHVEEGTCEIYVYPGGYGGINGIEGGVTNLCFIVSAEYARRCNSDPDRLISTFVSRNSRAASVLRDARAATPWLAVALEHFGRQSLVPATGLLTAGDAAAFIDPFTGSGMLMALESGELVASTISSRLKRLDAYSFKELARDYRRDYARKFESRLRLSSWLRRAAFVPRLAEVVIFLTGNDRLRERIARATRKSKLTQTDLPVGPRFST